MIIQLFKFLKGYVRIQVSGYSPERFLNLCSNHNILLWDIENYKDYYIMCISIKGFFRLKPILRKTRTKVVILKKNGLPFLMPGMWKRKIFLLGLLGCLIALNLLSNHIWAIEIVGNHNVTTDLFMDFLKEQGITYGMPKKEIDMEGLKKEIRNQYNIITWTSAKILGTKLLIQVKENIVLPQVEEKEETTNTPMDLVTTKEGTIVKMITRNGTPMVAAGQKVLAGDVLVSGMIPILGEDGLVRAYQYCTADADIHLQCSYPYEDSVNYEYEKDEYTGEEKKSYYMEFFGYHLGLPHGKVKYESFDKVENKKQLKILDNLYLPIYVGTIQYREYKTVMKTYSKVEAKEILQERLRKFLATLEEKGVEIIQNNVKIELAKKDLKCKGEIIVVELAGSQVPAQADPIPPPENTEIEGEND